MRQIIVDFGQLQIGGWHFALRIYGYGLMLVGGFLCGIALGRWRARRFGEDPRVVPTLGLLALAGGVVGARAAYVVQHWDRQFAWRAEPLGEVLNITSGGLIYYGGVVLATALILAYLLIRRLPVRRYLDIITPSLMLGLAFGRVGCFLNGCCYGRRCRVDFPLAITFPYASRPLLKLDAASNCFGGASISPVFAAQAAGPLRPGDGAILRAPQELSATEARWAAKLRSLPVQPAQVYGIANALLICGLLLLISRLRRREGTVFAWMLILYPITRFVLESIRGDNPHELLALRLTHNQYTSAGTVLAAAVLLALLRLTTPAAGPFLAQRRARQEVRPASSARTRKGKA
ncbi:MAG: hypothetical protein B1H04_00725 [Planctomycetales bacterium 4484_123]|nr:MAG: hypothetical protein B1H04_00725 [Planctomycetales bacterium 4484_123]